MRHVVPLIVFGGQRHVAYMPSPWPCRNVKLGEFRQRWIEELPRSFVSELWKTTHAKERDSHESIKYSPRSVQDYCL